MLKFAKENNFEIIFVVPFEVDKAKNSLYYLKKYREAAEVLSSEGNCTILDLVEYLNKIKIDKKELFIDACHPNAKGNMIIAWVIYKLLEDKWKNLIELNKIGKI